jgi:hypothetical protein
MTEITRPLYLANDIVFLDGMSGTGKSILGPILGAFNRVEKQALNHTFEHMCVLHHLGKVTTDAAKSFLGIYSDLALYNSLISREVNFRPGDDSGIFNNPNAFDYLKRVFAPDGAAVVDQIEKKRPILQIMTHQVFPAIDVAFEAFNGRLKVIEMVRHPIYMVDHWRSYIDRYGEDARELGIWIKHKGKSLPWFAAGWEEQFASVDSMTKVVMSIDFLFKKLLNIIDQKKYGDKLLIIPFEKLVLDPSVIMKQLEQFLGTTASSTLLRTLKRQKCPRLTVSAGVGKSKYSWNEKNTSLSEKEVQEKKWNTLKKEASTEALKIMESLCQQYEKRFFRFEDDGKETSK